MTEATYDENNRLTKYGSTEDKYDGDNNPTTEGSVTNTYNEGDELEKGTGVTYAYDERGDRTKRTPETGPATTYGYDQVGELISVERPEKESVPKIEDSYAYNGEGLRTSQTISGTTTHLAWEMSEGLPLILSDGTNSYIYGPGGIPVEQINNTTGTVSYLHHDQAGSTRLITGSTGTVTGKCTYAAYGAPTCEGTTTTQLGYDGQYTSSDTGLVYMRARVYDPTTAQFLTVDPLAAITGAPYNYASDNPVNEADPTGLGAVEVIVSSCEEEPIACAFLGAAGGTAGVIAGKRASEEVINAMTSGEPTYESDEGEAELKTKEAGRESEEPCGEEPPPRRLPYQGEPNSTAVLDRGNGTGQIREYGPDGLPTRDFDFGHDHGSGDPHAHDWPGGIRGDGRPIEPNE